MLDGAVARGRAAVDRAIGRALAHWAAPSDALEGWVVHRDRRWNREAEQEATRALVRAPGASAGCARSRYYPDPV